MGNMPMFVSETPEYEVIDGRMHIRLGNIELVMPVWVCMAGMRKCQRALDTWHNRQIEVVPFGH